jgi:hypothetical protein
VTLASAKHSSLLQRIYGALQHQHQQTAVSPVIIINKYIKSKSFCTYTTLRYDLVISFPIALFKRNPKLIVENVVVKNEEDRKIVILFFIYQVKSVCSHFQTILIRVCVYRCRDVMTWIPMLYLVSILLLLIHIEIYI